MVTITLKYTDYGEKETTEFRDYVKNLIGYIDQNVTIGCRYGVEHDPMFDDKIVAQISISDEDVAFDVVNHFMMEREVNGESVPFDVDISSVAIYVTGSDKIMDYLTSRSFSSLYERIEIAENMISSLTEKYQALRNEHDQMAAFVQRVGADKFPEIIKEVIDSMEAEGHECKLKINEILQRRVH
jgi:hypothetical protein